MNYKQTVDWIFEKLPMYQRVGAPAYKADLKNTTMLMQMTGNPHQGLQCVHVAGTNGKGSVSHMIASALQESGLKTGLYTSPHLFDYRERIRINGQKISQKFILAFIEKYKHSIEQIQPSFFEISVALAFAWFKEQSVDFAVIETGMGGRLDSTNVITPLLSVITNISLDHTMFLGDTPEQIAFEKAGIIKEHIPVVIGETDENTMHVFKKIARERNAPLKRADKHLYFLKNDAIQTCMSGNILHKGIVQYKNLQCPLLGDYQRKNIVTVVKSLQILKTLGLPINKRTVRRGIKNVKGNTGIMGRWDVVSEKPKVICDVAHNNNGLKTVFHQLMLEKCTQLHIVFGMNNDKHPEAILELLPAKAEYYFCRANVPRAMEVDAISEQADKMELKYTSHPSVKDAFNAAMKNAHKDKDIIFCGGSTFVVAEIPLLKSKYAEINDDNN